MSSPTGWTPDSTAVFVRSNREGSWGIYKHPIYGGVSKPVATDLGDVSWVTPVTPDFKWLLYAARDTSHSGMRWMRLPLSGGSAEEIPNGNDDILCSTSSGGSCIAAEQSANGKEIVFKALDTIKGPGQILARFSDEHAKEFGFDLSPDGSVVVVFRHFDNRLRLLSLHGHFQVLEFPLKGDVHLSTISWAANSKGWFAANVSRLSGGRQRHPKARHL